MPDADPDAPVAYVMSRFPKLTETFILDELVAVDRQGCAVELFPLLRERADDRASGGRALGGTGALPAVRLAADPALQSRHARPTTRGAISATWAAMVRGTARSPNFLLGGIGIFPKVVHASRLMTDLGVAHVHCHFANHPALAGFLIHRLAGIPYSFTAHGSDLHVDKTMLAQKVREAAFVVTISRSNAAVITEACGDAVDHLVVIHCGIDGAVFRPDRAAVAGPPLRHHLHRHPARGEGPALPHRRPLPDLVRRGVDIQVAFVGDGPDRERLERQVGRPRTRRPRRVPRAATRAQVIERLADDRRPRRAERPDRRRQARGPAGGPHRGARRRRRRSWPATCPGSPSWSRRTSPASRSRPATASALADALERLAGDPALRARLAAGGRARVAAEFDLDTNARRLIALFHGAAPSRGAA